MNIKPPDSFDFQNPNEWTRWIRRFDRYRDVSGLSDKDDCKQISTLIYVMGEDAEEIFQSFKLDEVASKRYQDVRDSFERHFSGKKNIVFERAKFNMRSQREGESIDQFITSLFTLAETCEFKALNDELIRDRIVVGILDKQLSERLQLDPDLTLSKAMDIARQCETVKHQQSVLRSEDDHKISRINTHAKDTKLKLSNDKRQHSRPPPRRSQTSNYSQQSFCHRCGKKPKHSREQCPAQSAVCRYCNIVGHFAAMCRTGTKKKSLAHIEGQVRRRSQECDNDKDDDPCYTTFLGSVACVTPVTHGPSESVNNKWDVLLNVEGEKMKFKLDSGADVTCISDQLYKRLKTKPQLTVTDKNLVGPNGVNLETRGHFTATLSLNQRSCLEKIYVVENLSTPLLGKPGIEKLGVLKRVNAVSDGVKQQFPNLFKGLGEIKGTQYTILLKPNAKPYALNVARRVPFPLMESVKQELEKLELQGVIYKQDKPTEWCAGIVVVPKSLKSGEEMPKVRLCVDLTKLNESVMREAFPLPSVEETLAKLSGATVFSKLDANSSFYQIPLDEASSLLTTFITPFGRYSFRRLPFGISSAPEFFTKQMSKIVEGLPGVICHMDDVLIFGADQKEHDERLRNVLQKIEDAGMTLNDKCQFSRREIQFLGHIINATGIKADPHKIEAIQRMREPGNLKELRTFLGLVNQMGRFTSKIADLTKPLRELLSKSAMWTWDTAQKDAFEKIKKELCSIPILAHYDVNRETILSSDASSYGLGAVLSQKQDDGSFRPVAFASRSMTDTECRYAQIEKEALAITWGCEKFYQMIIGKPIKIQTDHKPLISILNEKDIDSLPPRVQRFRLRLMRFSYKCVHVPGKMLNIPDALSRFPLANECNEEDKTLEDESELFVNVVTQNFPATEQRLLEIKEAQNKDDICAQLRRFCVDGWPKSKAVSQQLKPFCQVAGEITIADGFLLKGTRLIIPENMRNTILQKLHEGHLGIVKCQRRARQSVWWPGITRDIDTIIRSCRECSLQSRTPTEPLLATEFPELPWQKIAVDIMFLNNSHYLVAVDYFSRFIEVAKLSRLSALSVIEQLKSIFARHGIPEVVRSDNNPFNSAEFLSFSRQYDFKLITSSPRYPKSNGEAERAVQTVKDLLKKSRDPYLALLAYRSTPLQNGYTPSQLLMGRNLRSTVPTLPQLPRWPDFTALKEGESEAKRKQSLSYNRRHRSKELSSLEKGQKVWIRRERRYGTVIAQHSAPRSYIVQTKSGSFRRNRSQLVPVTDSSDKPSPSEHPFFPFWSAPNASRTDTAAPPAVDDNQRRSRYGRPIRRPERLIETQ